MIGTSRAQTSMFFFLSSSCYFSSRAEQSRAKQSAADTAQQSTAEHSTADQNSAHYSYSIAQHYSTLLVQHSTAQ